MKSLSTNSVLFAFIIACFLCPMDLNAQVKEISNFGTNPGNLRMYLFEPSTSANEAGVVLVLHGCGQTAEAFAEQTGWNVLAETYGFYVVYAEQKAGNNPTLCFNWFLSRDNQRGEGEARSLIEMIDFVHANYPTDSTKSFVCGLSAGGSMTPVVMACYPDKINAGGIWAGVPYLYSPRGDNDFTSQEWGSNVRQAFNDYTGSYPRLFICQGSEDAVTDPINQQRLIQQWTNVHQADQVVDGLNLAFDGNASVEEEIFLNPSGDTIIKSYLVDGMGHGVAIDPGMGKMQGGKESPGAFDVDFFSTFWMADYFGLLDDRISPTHDWDESAYVELYVDADGSLIIQKSGQLGAVQFMISDITGRILLSHDLIEEKCVISLPQSNSPILAVTFFNPDGDRLFSRLVKR